MAPVWRKNVKKYEIVEMGRFFNFVNSLKNSTPVSNDVAKIYNAKQNPTYRSKTLRKKIFTFEAQRQVGWHNSHLKCADTENGAKV